jgi:uridine kinase
LTYRCSKTQQHKACFNRHIRLVGLLDVGEESPTQKNIMSLNPIIIGICGGTASGKTTFCKKLSEAIGPDVAVINHDMYYKDLSHLHPNETAQHNFDHPEALDNALFFSHLIELKNGISVRVPVYDFSTHTHIGKLNHIRPSSIILAEGLTLFTNPQIRDVFDFKVFINLEADIRFIRRLKRDIKERNRTVESVIEQYLSTVKPMHDKYVEPSRKFADVIVSGTNFDKGVHSILLMIADTTIGCKHIPNK